MANKYYAVKEGRRPGIYTTWDECKAQTNGYPGAVYKSFKTEDDTRKFMGVETQDAEPSEPDKRIADTLPPGKDLTAYTDGSWRPQLPDCFGYGLAIFEDPKKGIMTKHGLVTDNPEMAKTRNVAGEIKAAISAINLAIELRAKSLTIYHDYQGISKWADGLWKTNNEYTRSYQNFVRLMRRKIDIKFVHVKGHSGDEFNELADALANKGYEGLI